MCRWVWERTDNGALATTADWFIGKPLEILLILVVAWIVSRVARRAIRRGVYRLVLTDRQIGHARADEDGSVARF